MNDLALLHFASTSLHTIVKKLDANLYPLLEYCKIPDFTDPYFDRLPLTEWRSFCVWHKKALLSNYGGLHYSLIPAAKNYLLLGPFLLMNPPALKYIYEISIEKEFLNNCSIVSYDELERLSGLLYDSYRDDPYPEMSVYAACTNPNPADRSVLSDYHSLLFSNSENDIHHNSYSQEYREQLSIENGDIESLKKALAEDYTGSLGTLSPNALRNIKNLGIVVATLASRSAIRGGLSSEIAFSLSDTYIQQIEKLNNTTAILQLIRNMEYHYTDLVHQIKTEKKGKKNNPHIEKCKNYIFSHLHDPITVNTLAKEMGYHPDYLSHLFVQNEGIRLSSYIAQERLNRSKNLLIYSDYTYNEIAAYLGFASHSYFCKQFKKYIGCTPKQFREQNRNN